MALDARLACAGEKVYVDHDVGDSGLGLILESLVLLLILHRITLLILGGGVLVENVGVGGVTIFVPSCTDVGRLLSFGVPLASGSGSVPFVERSSTDLLLGYLPIANAWFSKLDLFPANVTRANNVMPRVVFLGNVLVESTKRLIKLPRPVNLLLAVKPVSAVTFTESIFTLSPNVTERLSCTCTPVKSVLP